MSFDFLKDFKVPGVVPALILVMILSLINANVTDPLILNIATMILVTILKAIQVNVVKEVEKIVEGHRGHKAPTTAYRPKNTMTRFLMG